MRLRELSLSGFKFPLKSDSAASSPTTSTGIASAPVSASTNGPAGSVYQPAEDIPLESESTKTEAQPTVDAIVAETVSTEPAAIEAPTTPTVMVTPPAESTETLPTHDSHGDHDHPEPHRASTIDEAIAEFNSAVGKPADDEHPKADEGVPEATSRSIDPVLTPVEEILKESEETKSPIAEAEQVKEDADAEVENEVTEEGDDDASPVSTVDDHAPKAESRKVAEVVQADEVEEEGDKTMDEIDLT